MGLSVSQVRLLSITNRSADVEYSANNLDTKQKNKEAKDIATEYEKQTKQTNKSEKDIVNISKDAFKKLAEDTKTLQKQEYDKDNTLINNKKDKIDDKNKNYDNYWYQNPGNTGTEYKKDDINSNIKQREENSEKTMEETFAVMNSTDKQNVNYSSTYETNNNKATISNETINRKLTVLAMKKAY